MSKMEYAKEVAKEVNGVAKEVEKNNGVKVIGVEVNTGSNVRPMVYIDEMYDRGLTVYEAADKVATIAQTYAKDELDISWIADFEKVRPMLRARLLNKATSAEVFKQAGGVFNDLIIVPYIDGVCENGSIKVRQEMLKVWKVTAEEVISQAEENSRKEAKMQSMSEIMAEMGYPLVCDDMPPMIVISNEKGCYGAYSILAMLDQLKTLFPEGFAVLPSSVHEVIIVNAEDPAYLDSMVSDVNDKEVDPNEQLSGHAYLVA